MSAQTLAALEAAILAHHRDTTDADDTPERAGAVIAGWVVGYEYSNLVDLGEEDGGTVVGFQNDYMTSDTSPNQVANLARWASKRISRDAFGPYDEE